MLHRKLQNVVYMKKNRCSKKNIEKKGGGATSKREKKGGNIGSCPHVPVLQRLFCDTHFNNKPPKVTIIGRLIVSLNGLIKIINTVVIVLQLHVYVIKNWLH